MSWASVSSEGLSAGSFLPHVGETFFARFGEESRYPLRLEKVTELPHSRSPVSKRVPFRLLFTGPGYGVLRQATYKVDHEKLADLEIFLTPLDEAEGSFSYQAVFT